jgi:hypothetical protein
VFVDGNGVPHVVSSSPDTPDTQSAMNFMNEQLRVVPY